MFGKYFINSGHLLSFCVLITFWSLSSVGISLLTARIWKYIGKEMSFVQFLVEVLLIYEKIAVQSEMLAFMEQLRIFCDLLSDEWFFVNRNSSTAPRVSLARFISLFLEIFIFLIYPRTSSSPYPTLVIIPYSLCCF